MSGINFAIEKNEEILSLNSPKTYIGGPYVVVYKSIENRWAIVALDWDKKPRLGIRWFWDNGGSPFSSGHPTWFIIPEALNKSTLDGLTIESYSLRVSIERFLAEEITGKELMARAIE